MHRSLLKDVQSEADTRRVPIKRVGIRDLKMPIRIKRKEGGTFSTVAEVCCSVNLPAEARGTHMSRFCAALEELQKEWRGESLEPFLISLKKRLQSEEAYILISFDYLIRKTSPKTGLRSFLSYRCSFFAGLTEEGVYRMTLEENVPVSTVCPCSKEISKHGAHNQRTSIRLRAVTAEFVWLEDLIRNLERCGSCELYTILKRPDEKAVTEKAYENPRFVEDVLREAVLFARSFPLEAFEIEVESLESIHNHAAFAWTEEEGG